MWIPISLALLTPQSSPSLLVDLNSEPAGSAVSGAVAVLGTASGRLWFSASPAGTDLQLSQDGGLPPTLWSLRAVGGELELYPPNGQPGTFGKLEEPLAVHELTSDRLLVTLADRDCPGQALGVLDPASLESQLLIAGVIGEVVTVGDRAYFFRSDGSSTEVWRTDGTLAGTVLLLEVEGQVQTLPASGPTPLGSDLVLAVRDSPFSRIWSVPAAGGSPTLLKSNAGFLQPEFLAVPGGLVFDWRESAGSPAFAGTELWFTDGTPAGTVELLDIDPGTASSTPEMVESNGSLAYFTARQGGIGRELWKTDGTPSGTGLVVDLFPGAGSGAPLTKESAAFLGAELLFTGAPDATDRELYRTDGTAAGTQLLIDLEPGSAGSQPVSLAEAAGGVAFLANVGQGDEPYFTNGATTFALGGPGPGGPQIGVGAEVFSEFQGAIYFVGDDSVTGREFWNSPPQPDAATLAADLGYLGTYGSDFFGPLLRAGDVGYFVTRGSISSQRLYLTDGTPSGTKSIWSETDIELLGALDRGVVLLGTNLLGVSSLYSFPGSPGALTDLGVPSFSSGTPSNEGSSANVVQFGARAYFTLRVQNELRLWSTDGTAFGSESVYWPQPDVDAGFGMVRDLIRTDRALYFTTAEVPGGPERLWAYDPAAGQGSQVAVLALQGRRLAAMAPLGAERLVLAAERADGLAPMFELWMTDGTEDGTVLLEASAESFASPSAALGTLGGDVLFRRPAPATSSSALVRLDPSGHRTLLLDAGPDGDVRYPAGDLYFGVYRSASNGTELWFTDGTLRGTRGLGVPGDRAQRIGTGPAAFFPGVTAGTGIEPWITDGTPQGTGLWLDANRGRISSCASGLGRVGDLFLFSALNEETGLELHALELVEAGAYVAEPLGAGCGDPAPELEIEGEPRPGEQVTLRVETALPLAPVLHYVSVTAIAVPLSNCTVYLSSPVLFASAMADGAGTADLAFSLGPGSEFVGARLFLQAAVVAAGGPALETLELTNALELVFGL